GVGAWLGLSTWRSSGNFQSLLSRSYWARGNCTSNGFLAGSSHASTDSSCSCGMAVQPTVPSPCPLQMCMKTHDPLPGVTGFALWSTTIPHRYSPPDSNICSELFQSGE